jgi:hypothetical protein
MQTEENNDSKKPEWDLNLKHQPKYDKTEITLYFIKKILSPAALLAVFFIPVCYTIRDFDDITRDLFFLVTVVIMVITIYNIYQFIQMKRDS